MIQISGALWNIHRDLDPRQPRHSQIVRNPTMTTIVPTHPRDLSPLVAAEQPSKSPDRLSERTSRQFQPRLLRCHCCAHPGSPMRLCRIARVQVPRASLCHCQVHPGRSHRSRRLLPCNTCRAPPLMKCPGIGHRTFRDLQHCTCLCQDQPSSRRNADRRTRSQNKIGGHSSSPGKGTRGCTAAGLHNCQTGTRTAGTAYTLTCMSPTHRQPS
mmetsp:Transcript_25457/g.61581  ORF Transcript_25457/g.61581 Transcript_25457/m.61581 type:complete len:213 (-) Transcript_25457:947-1585(-)